MLALEISFWALKLAISRLYLNTPHGFLRILVNRPILHLDGKITLPFDKVKNDHPFLQVSKVVGKN